MRPSLHSPQPTRPSSVVTLTNTHGRQPASHRIGSIFAIFIVPIPSRIGSGLQDARIGEPFRGAASGQAPTPTIRRPSILIDTGVSNWATIGYRPGMTGAPDAPTGDSAMSVSPEANGLGLARRETTAESRAIEA